MLISKNNENPDMTAVESFSDSAAVGRYSWSAATSTQMNGTRIAGRNG